MKERPVGTVFNWHRKQLQVIEDEGSVPENDYCVFGGKNCLSHYDCMEIPCLSTERSDKKSVHFIQVEDED